MVEYVWVVVADPIWGGEVLGVFRYEENARYYAKNLDMSYRIYERMVQE